jgi:hypothetical protein
MMMGGESGRVVEDEKEKTQFFILHCDGLRVETTEEKNERMWT